MNFWVPKGDSSKQLAIWKRSGISPIVVLVAQGSLKARKWQHRWNRCHWPRRNTRVSDCGNCNGQADEIGAIGCKLNENFSDGKNLRCNTIMLPSHQINVHFQNWSFELRLQSWNFNHFSIFWKFCSKCDNSYNTFGNEWYRHHIHSIQHGKHMDPSD